jgi:hypothetical protein
MTSRAAFEPGFRILTERAISMTVATLIRALFPTDGVKPRADASDRWFPIKAALALLALYAVMHLLVGAVLHFWIPDMAFLYIQPD